MYACALLLCQSSVGCSKLFVVYLQQLQQIQQKLAPGKAVAEQTKKPLQTTPPVRNVQPAAPKKKRVNRKKNEEPGRDYHLYHMCTYFDFRSVLV